MRKRLQPKVIKSEKKKDAGAQVGQTMGAIVDGVEAHKAHKAKKAKGKVK